MKTRTLSEICADYFGRHTLGFEVENKPDPFDNIENVFFNSKKGTTVIKWKNGTTSKSTCDVQDNFEPFIGFCIAYATKDVSKSKLKERVLRKFKKNNNG